MKQKAVIVAPGRGTYNAPELGYIQRYHANRETELAAFDALRRDLGQPTISDLDGASRFSPDIHLRGDNASGLIFASSYLDFLAIDRDKFDTVAVTGNSMGWYTALACAGAMDGLAGLRLVNTMGMLMHEHMIGGQVLYPIVDSDWTIDEILRDSLLERVHEINTKQGLTLALSIDLGGMLVLAGNKAGLDEFDRIMPRSGNYPMRLAGHAGFHTDLQNPVSKKALTLLNQDLFSDPDRPLIDGRGFIWHHKATDSAALRDYTLKHQVVAPFDFATSIRMAAREFMPDVFILLGPGGNLGGAIAQTLIDAEWRGWRSRDDFTKAQNGALPRLLSMGRPEQRVLVTAKG
ncbi:MAG TPA: ACP S-malonyltransferase [Aliiroseovarius sp.]|nr:ACP S-malonyltransferase [Aliiroseovarius sp.]